jgi:hypothetical protein
MSNRVIKVGITFEFYPDTEHEDLFEEMTEDEIVENAKSLFCEDIDRLVKYGETYDALSVEIVTKD